MRTIDTEQAAAPVQVIRVPADTIELLRTLAAYETRKMADVIRLALRERAEAEGEPFARFQRERQQG